MKYTIYSDLHWGQVSQIRLGITPKKGDFFIGDIFDIKNTSKKIIKQQLAAQASFNSACRLIGAHVLLGNHDLLPDDLGAVERLNERISFSSPARHIVDGDVLFTHGHYIAWDQSQIDQWKAKKPNGVGFFRGITLAGENLYTRGIWKPSQVELDRCFILASSLSCKTIVFGHTHTEKTVDIEYKGIRIVNVGRGMTQIEL